MAFLVKADFKTHIYSEIIAAIDRDDEDLLDDAIATAEGIAKSYLSRFNITTLFSAAGSDRDPVLLMYCKDMAVWHFCVLANPSISLEHIRDRNDDAIKELGKMQSGKVVPDGWPLAAVAEGETNSMIDVNSAEKRETNW